MTSCLNTHVKHMHNSVIDVSSHFFDVSNIKVMPRKDSDPWTFVKNCLAISQISGNVHSFGLRLVCVCPTAKSKTCHHGWQHPQDFLIFFAGEVDRGWNFDPKKGSKANKRCFEHLLASGIDAQPFCESLTKLYEVFLGWSLVLLKLLTNNYF